MTITLGTQVSYTMMTKRVDRTTICCADNPKVWSQHRLRISPKKFVLFCTQADVGGALHPDGGMIPNPARYQGIIDEPEPETLDLTYYTQSYQPWVGIEVKYQILQSSNTQSEHSL